MQLPGAIRSTSAPKLEKFESVSSTSLVQVDAAPPPGFPLKSASEDTVITSSYAAGTELFASLESFPAATTNVTPAATARQIALCSESLFELPQLLSSEPPPERLMFTT